MTEQEFEFVAEAVELHGSMTDKYKPLFSSCYEVKTEEYVILYDPKSENMLVAKNDGFGIYALSDQFSKESPDSQYTAKDLYEIICPPAYDPSEWSGMLDN